MRVELRHITAGYGSIVALRDVDLVVPEDKVVVLLGPNGAGKTTLLRVASGLLRPQTGQVLLDEEDATGLAPHEFVNAGVCHITEGRSVFPSLTVRENLRLFARGESGRDGVARVLEAFPKLGNRLGQVAGTMSGGEQQMLALARAYAVGAPLVMLDEMSMGLAPVIVDEIFDHFRALAGNGTGLLLVEQYAAKALELADLVYLLVRGRIIMAGEPREISDTDLFSQYLGAENLHRPNEPMIKPRGLSRSGT